MNNTFMAKQKICNLQGGTFAYELLFRDSKFGITKFPSNLQATAHVLIHTLTNVNLDELLGKRGIAFVNVDETILLSGMLDVLSPERFVLEILETTELTDKIVAKIKQYSKRGFKIALDDFDCSSEMFETFSPIFKYLDIIKMDLLQSEPENLEKVMKRLKDSDKILLAEKVETKKEYDQCVSLGFKLFQGYFLSKPEIIEVESYKEATKIVILQLIQIIKDDGTTKDIEKYLKLQADLSYKLIRFINNHIENKCIISTLTQAITMLGREKLLKWLLMYLYSETSNNPASEIFLDMAVKRAEKLEAQVESNEKEKAYIIGLFSMLDTIFETDMSIIMSKVNLGHDITNIIVEKKGRFSTMLEEISRHEHDYFRKLINENFYKLDMADIIYTLEYAGVEIDKDKL